MATKTKAELVRRVLDKLQKTQTGQNPAAEDVDQVATNLSTALATIAADEVVYISDPDQIEEAFFEPVAVCVAGQLARDFGTAVDPVDLADAEATLRRIQRLRPMYVEQQASYV